MADDRALTMLHTALEMEEKGRKFYDDAARNAENPLGKEIFEMLRDYEVQHTERIKDIYDNLKAGEGWREDRADFAVASDLGQVFRKLAREQKEHITPATGDMEALGVGIEFESTAVNFYEQQVPLAQNPLEKKFLEHMVAEEREHLNLLTDMRHYYQDPETWFQEKERIHLD